MNTQSKKAILIHIILLLIFFLWVAIGSHALADQYVVTADKVYVRSTPDTDGAKLGKLCKEELVEVIKIGRGDWATIQYNGKTAYVAKQYLRYYDPNAAMLCIANTTVNFRAEPSKSATSLCKIQKGVAVTAYHVEGKWRKVIYNGETGYVYASYLNTVDDVGEVLGAYTTSYAGSSRGRKYNIEYGAEKLSETVIKPRGFFSLLDVLGPITKEGAYKEAPEFKDGETVTGYGGGVCQIATTLYQAVKVAQDNARFKINERHVHSKEVGYIAQGEDATISYNSGYDFCFTNKNAYSVKILVYATRDNLTVAIVKV